MLFVTKYLLVLSLFALSVKLQDQLQADNPDLSKSFQEIVESNGFVFEEHNITTKDGFILRCFRIPGALGEALTHSKPPVLLAHGLVDSADTWVMNHGDQSTPFILSRGGYDVWFWNSRGNKYSKDYIGTKTNFELWDYDFETLADYDIPATMDYIFALTNQRKVAYLGHSQGATQMLYGLATNEAYFADKISIFLALGPVTKMNKCRSKLVSFIG